MSDISLGPGVGVVAGVYFSLGVAAGWLLLALVYGMLTAAHGQRFARVRSLAVGPIVCVAFALVLALCCILLRGGPLRWLDEHFELIPVGAFTFAVGISLRWKR
jgi:hypothetical protein